MSRLFGVVVAVSIAHHAAIVLVCVAASLIQYTAFWSSVDTAAGIVVPAIVKSSIETHFA